MMHPKIPSFDAGCPPPPPPGNPHMHQLNPDDFRLDVRDFSSKAS